jgi:hypothetical protein
MMCRPWFARSHSPIDQDASVVLYAERSKGLLQFTKDFVLQFNHHQNKVPSKWFFQFVTALLNTHRKKRYL